MSYYKRIACLSTEAVETLYRLGAADQIVGVSGYTVRPPEARTEKVKISGFSSAKIDRILAVQPDLVIAYSNIQAEICKDLVSAGIEVHVFNHKDLAGIPRMIDVLGALVGRTQEANALNQHLLNLTEHVKAASAHDTIRPRIYFEEWDEPMMSGIGWVSELIQCAGGIDVFEDRAQFHSARDRILADPQIVIERQPDIIIGSWCGKKFQAERVMARENWSSIPAVKNQHLYEIKSADILSPGPSAIEYGLLRLREIIQAWQLQQAN